VKTRRLIQSANSLVITLPVDFVRRSGLKKGDVVAVAYDSLLVIVNPNEPKGVNENDAKSNTD
jgi:antitoxin component of MazEF toxin-antitoxin module